MKTANTDTEEAKIVISLCCKLQSAVHDIDALSDRVIFKQELKQKTNNFLKYIEQRLDYIGRAFDPEESQYFVDIVKKIDEIGEAIEVEQANTEGNGSN